MGNTNPISDKEIRDSYSIKSEGKIVSIAFLVDYPLEEYNYRAAFLFAEDIDKILKKDTRFSYCGLIDMSHLGNTIGFLSKRTREEYARVINNEQIEKIAFFGLNKYYEVAINFMIGLTNKRNKTRIFGTEKDARDWLMV